MREKALALLLSGLLGYTACESPASRGAYVDKYRIGRSATSDGTAGNETSTFSIGDSIYMSFEVKNVPSNSSVQVVFSSLPDNRKMAELDKKTSGKGLVSFELKNPGWPPGTYRAEYFVVDGPKRIGLGLHDFVLAPASGNATPRAAS